VFLRSLNVLSESALITTLQVAFSPVSITLAVITALPSPTPVTLPSSDTVATLSSLDAHSTGVLILLLGVMIAVSSVERLT